MKEIQITLCFNQLKISNISFYLFYFFYFCVKLQHHQYENILVSSLEKSSKKSPSPSAPSSNQKSFNIIKPHHDEPIEDKKSSPDAIDANSNSRSVAANSLDLSSDDDHVDMSKMTGPSGSSTTTTTSSSFIDNKQKTSLQSFDEELKSFMNATGLPNDANEKSESDKENVLVNENFMKFKAEEQKTRESISSISSIHLKNGNENKVKISEN